jgi:hypothetical protein
MAINAVIKSPRLIVANTSALVSSQAQPPIDLKNNGSSVSQQYLSHLLDVSINTPTDGQVLTYNANTGKYDLVTFAANVNNAIVDGGSF